MENERQARDEEAASEMHKRRITLDDGRYLIFYTFDGDDSSAVPQSTSASSQVEPQAAPSAEEERSV
ncbi:MAG TPA: hypothetical protein VGB73_08335 [Pyrinomonadaceae bacterium]|jgi:hypothetical protein